MIRILFTSVLITCLSISTSAQKFGTGTLLDPELYKDSPRSAPLTRGDYLGLPSNYSLKKFTPTPQNQGSTSTCTAWATSYAARTMLEAMKNNWSKEEIDKNVFSPSFVYNQIRYKPNCSIGTSIVQGLDILKNLGDLPYNEFGFDCERNVGDADKVKAGEYKIIDYRELFWGENKNKTMLVKKSLSESKPVVIAFDCPDSFQDVATDLYTPLSGDYKNWSSGHALTVIGYDDEKYGGAFELMNSWGTGWGDKGYAWIKYNDFDYFSKFGFEVLDVSKPKVASVDLSGSLLFRDSNGKIMKSIRTENYFQTVNNYKSGTLFELLISNDEPAYIYAFATDLSYKVNKIFPMESNISAYLPYKNNNVAIPDEDSYNMLDSSAGTSYFCFLYSKESLNFNLIIKQFENAKGNVWERLTKVLGDKLLDNKDIEFKNAETISFKGKSSIKTIIPVIFAIKHVK